MLTDKKEIIDFLKEYFHISGNYTISDDGVIDITDGFIEAKFEKFNKDGFTELPIQFGHVKGYFYFEKSNITTLKGFPHTVEKNDCSIDSSTQIKSLEFSPQCDAFFCNKCTALESLDGLNCEQFFGDDLKLKRFGINFTAKYFEFTKFPTPTADEMRRFIELNPYFKTEQQAQWITLINDYYENNDLFRAISEFENLYNEPWVKTENRIEIINSDVTMGI